MRPLLTGLIATSIFAGPAWSQDAATALWQHWQNSAEANGLSLQAEDTEESGQSLVLGSVTLSSDEGDRATLGALTLSETADGAIAVTVPSPVPVIIEPSGAAADGARSVFTLTSRDLVLQVDAPEAASRHKLSFAEAELRLTEIDDPDLDETPDFHIALTAGDGTYVPAADMPGRLDLTMGGAQFGLVQTDTGTGQRVAASGQTENIVLAVEDFRAVSETEPRSDFTLHATTGASTSMTESPLPSGDIMRVETAQDSFEVSLAATADRVEYDAQTAAVGLTVSGANLPVSPVTATIANGAFALSVPIAEDPAPQQAQGRLSLSGILPGDAIWSTFDPGSAMPRDPLDIEAAISAQVMVAGETAAPPTGTPLDMLPRAVEIEGIEIRYGETSLRASGAMTFSETAGQPYPVMPVGTITVNANGVQALLQQLTAAGLVSQQQAMGMQMMMGMFAQQGEGDSLSSTIESRDDGSLYVNGTRMR